MTPPSSSLAVGRFGEAPRGPDAVDVGDSHRANLFDRARQSLQRHPIAMSCHFRHSLVLAWALPAGVLEPLVPHGLTLDTYDDTWGFLAVALVHTERLRPASFPARLGRSYLLTGYRTFVRHTDAAGRERRGLHILRSDTDRRSMKVGGNLLTHYNYRLARIDFTEDDHVLRVVIATHHREADLDVIAHLDQPAGLPANSPFRSPLDARRFAGPLPWTFDHEAATDSIVMIHARRTNWRPTPVLVEVGTATFLDDPRFDGIVPVLANAFHVADVDYGWERGVRIRLDQADR